MQHMNASVTWLELVQQGDSVRSIATRAGVDNSTLSRQIKAGEIRSDMVIRIARGLGLDVIDALVASGHVTAGEAGVTRPSSTLRLVTDQQLADEILRRLELVHDKVLDDPLNIPRTPDNVHELTLRNKPSEVDDEVDILDLPYVAHEPDEDIDEDDDESRYDI